MLPDGEWGWCAEYEDGTLRLDSLQFYSTMPKLDWLTRPEDEKTAANVPYRLLEAVPELSYGDEQTENMLIQGDNLEALKALLPFYAGRVKCIFIDPPYNTRSAFEHYDDNLEHTQWLGMMYPRLELLREFLTEDGSIWVTIDDNEAHYLKVIMDEVFGRSNFVANVVWQKKYTVSNDSKWLSENHDHILLYAHNKEIWRPFRLGRSNEMNERYHNPDNHPKGPWKSTPLYAKRLGSEKERNFIFQFRNGVKWSPPRGSSPRFPEDTLRRMDENNEIWFGSDGSAIPSRKTFLRELKIEGTPAPTIWTHTEAGNNHEAREQVKTWNQNDSFSTPKPEKLIKRILELATSPEELVLDSFLGSGTTAAVAHKMERRYIGIEMGEHAETHCVPRLKKVVDGEQGGISEAVRWKGGGGFRFYRLGSQVFDEQGHIHPSIRFDHLAAHIWFAETRTPIHHKRKRSPLLGKHGETAYYLLYNGILGDKRPDGGNVLTRKVLAELPAHDGPKVIYGECSRLSAATLKQLDVIFKQTPYDVKAR
jgi:adenine-specific DNA-methyltransferase